MGYPEFIVFLVTANQHAIILNDIPLLIKRYLRNLRKTRLDKCFEKLDNLRNEALKFRYPIESHASHVASHLMVF